MNSLKIERKDVYEIEVNDKGDTIEFDLLDVSLPLKLNETYIGINKIVDKLKGDILLAQKKYKNSKKQVGIYSELEDATFRIYEKAFKDMRIEADKFFGKGACQKIFGDRNYLEMYNDLFEQLQPHFEKMKINVEGFKERIIKKYGDNETDVI